MTTVRAGTGDGVWTSEGSRLLTGHAIVDLDRDWVLLDGDTLSSIAGEQVRLPGPPATCLVDTADGVLVGTREAHLLTVKGDEVQRLASFDAAEGRDGWYTPWGAPADVRSLFVAADGTLYVNVHVGGILRSVDGGATWMPTIDVDADVHQVLAFGDDGVLAATAYGFAHSHDRGSTWSFSTAGLHGEYSRAVAVAGDWLLLSASTGPRTDRAAVYRRPLDAGDDVAFERCQGGLPEWFAGNVDTGGLAGLGSAAALATADGDVYLSEDSGASWQRVATGLGRVSRVRLA